MSSPRFEPSPYGPPVSVANHYIGLVTQSIVGYWSRKIFLFRMRCFNHIFRKGLRKGRMQKLSEHKVQKVPQIEEQVEIDLSHTKLDDNQKKELQTLFKSFRGQINWGLSMFCIDRDDKPPVVCRPYRYDRVKQKIIDYHVNKMLEEDMIILIQSPYTSPVVLCRKNNGLPPDTPEAYRFAID
ncbi:hypothetical protein TNCV_2056611 [Trichonephila clavipes]|nr:hypothetical protein TNCV_2056611 [Trichonephila clavipes]